MSPPDAAPGSASFELRSRMPDGSVAIVRDLDASGMTLETACDVFPGQQLQFELKPAGSILAFVATGLVHSVEHRDGTSHARVGFTLLRMQERR